MTAIYVYFIINIFIAGMSVNDFNTKEENIKGVLFLVFL